jgi:hypothetical protein
MAGEWYEPTQDEIEVACMLVQQSWTRKDRRRRKAGDGQKPVRYTIPQFLVHHEERGTWVGSQCKAVRVWRCVDGR